ncbi:3-deoxy-D-arabino-heptulosonate 7-phosphate synthase [Roseateles chitinivorans]|uniref:3-deoxy-D-arabino-heptulosonate 7-phosphate synthase n=1 Tax=Roseateles chitinivorans TaxID=2917965 RepID=UPI003D670AFE
MTTSHPVDLAVASHVAFAAPSSHDLPGFPPLLDDVLRRTPRRYRAPALPATWEEARAAGTATALAAAIEQARTALASGNAPADDARTLFVDALARLIGHAMRPLTAQGKEGDGDGDAGGDNNEGGPAPAGGGDPAFQAMVLRHRSPVVREYASLSAHAERDRRAVRTAVNALAHPKKTQRRAAGPTRDALLALHAAAGAGDWARVSDVLVPLHDGADTHAEPSLHRGLARLIDEPALTRLRRLDALSPDVLVARYRALWERRGPIAGSEQAAARGAGAQQRGDAVEVLAVQALDGLVDRMNAAAGETRYRIVASLRIPPSFPGDAQRAKSEWDVALLKRSDADGDWDLCLLVEAKASPDAATTDLPKLLRGLRLLAQADIDTTYAFTSTDGEVRLRGASLSALPTEEGDLARAVLYCCDGLEDRTPRLLSAASRMQLLCAEASLDFAAALEDGASADPSRLIPVWRLLLEAPAFTSVLRQYETLRAVRELMVHPGDLQAAVVTTTPSTLPDSR